MLRTRFATRKISFRGVAISGAKFLESGSETRSGYASFVPKSFRERDLQPADCFRVRARFRLTIVSGKLIVE